MSRSRKARRTESNADGGLLQLLRLMAAASPEFAQTAYLGELGAPDDRRSSERRVEPSRASRGETRRTLLDLPEAQVYALHFSRGSRERRMRRVARDIVSALGRSEQSQDL